MKIVFILIAILSLTFIFSALKVAKEADEEIEKILEEILEEMKNEED